MTEPRSDAPITDSALTFAEAVDGSPAPPEVIAALDLVEVRYRAFDGRLHAGQLVVHRDLVADAARDASAAAA